jgi:aspartate semialdehyde dehydrogenase (EC 1.2.1.11)
MSTIPVAVLGATGAVGQRFVQLLEGHPLFRVVALTGSERSAGKKYREVCRWVLDTPMPAAVADLTVLDADADVPAQLVFSALPSTEPAQSNNGWLPPDISSAQRFQPSDGTRCTVSNTEVILIIWP